LARGPGGRSFVWPGSDLLVFALFSGIGDVAFEPVAPPGNGGGQGLTQLTVQDRTSPGHVAQKVAPLGPSELTDSIGFAL
jgi:hypothetical protein